MASEVYGKIKIVRDRLEDFKKRFSTFSSLDQNLKDSEIFLNIQISDLSEEFTRVKSLHSDIIANGSEDDEHFSNYKADKCFQAIQNIYFKHTTSLHEFLKIIMKSDRQHDVTFSEISQGTMKKLNPNLESTSISYPYDSSLAYIQGSVPNFDGKYDKWPEFMYSFISNVHENNALTNGMKLRILQSLLKDDALKVIKREFSNLMAAEYDAVWNKLTSRYNHKRTIIYSYFSALVFQPQLEKECSEAIKSLYDTTYDTIVALKSLDLNCDEWGDLLLFIVYSKLPIRTKEAWNEKQPDSDSLPKFSTFLEFLERRFRTLESVEATRNDISTFSNKKQTIKRVSTLQSSSKPSKNENSKPHESQNHPSSVRHICKCCNKGPHSIRKCYKFKKMKPYDRLSLIKHLGYCTNCLSYSHDITKCISEGRCEHCKETHNSLLCLKVADINNGNGFNAGNIGVHNGQDFVPQSQSMLGVPSTCDGRFTLNPTTLMSASEENQSVVFPTALVKVKNSEGGYVVLRAMVDSCSDASYITESAARKLRLPIERVNIQVSGLGNNVTSESKGMTSFNIHSLVKSTFNRKVNAYVLSLISPNRPLINFKATNRIPESIKLADPNFNHAAKIDLLLGGEVDCAIFKSGSFKSDNIIYRETELGWIVSGCVSHELNCFTAAIARTENLELVFKSLDQSIRRFWEIEELPVSRALTGEEMLCEEIYEATTIRLPTGRYSVSLPFKRKISGFSNMRKIALSRFGLLEKRFSKNAELKGQYASCLQEYIEMGHMSEVDPSKFLCGYYIPHHCVFKEDSSTTKLRVVFDASAKDFESQSLNENIMNGPRLQPELIDHLLRFRFFKIAFTADVAKMYRQILINSNDRKFQLILWRPNPEDKLKTYCLNTVTFGTTSAPYLAVKTLFRLAEDEIVRFPKGSLCLKTGFYVDDCIYGADNISEALDIQYQTRMILSSAGFHLRKWSSNSKELVRSVPENDRETNDLLSFDSKSSVKTLGVQWCPSEDNFHYDICLSNASAVTKRSILSDVAKIFDPLGWISPCVIKAKILIQELWSEKIDWDQPIPTEHLKTWINIRDGLRSVSNDIKVSRWLHTVTGSDIEVHGFSDASQKAYAAAIYIKTGTHVNLLFAKTRVAPLKQISLPRLELMGAVMLAKAMNHCKNVCQFRSAEFYYWCDSQIALAWIKDEPQKRAVFVGNRVSEIQSLTNPKDWYYVESKENPADLGTRGISAIELPSLNLWWGGPAFIQDFRKNDYNQTRENVVLPKEDDVKRKSVKSVSILQTFISNKRSSLQEISSNIFKFKFEPLNKFSTLSKLVRIIAYCLRFRKSNRSSHSHISPSEYDKALLTILRVVQMEAFTDEVLEIQTDGVPKTSKIFSLNPFVNDHDGLLRVSGRLENATHLNYDQKHPVILPYSHIISKLIVSHAHLTTLHGTEQQTFLLVSQRYHIIRCRSLIRLITNNCVKCFRYRCATQQQLMGQLPKLRITPNRPFLNCGVDFAGPFEIKKFRGRCKTHYKSYFAVFVCFSTKAVHLEVVIDLSTPAFIAAYRRFISRRGLVQNLYSDCGSNFKGAEKRITRSMVDQENEWNEIMSKELAEFKTTWHFNPPGSPHFGGLWEAGVKSVKHHLKRIVGNTKLTYDEFETVLLQIEACLNSRPLCRSNDFKDCIVITPAHFLIQDSLLSLPDDNLLTNNTSLSNRWDLLQKMVQDFWKIWNHEYLNTVRQRQKWRLLRENLKVDDVVVIQEKKLPPNSWLLARVVEVHCGADGLVRVVSLKTEKSSFLRPVTKLCPLPIHCD